MQPGAEDEPASPGREEVGAADLPVKRTPRSAHRRVESGMTLLIEAQPEEAFVLVNGVVIGRALDVKQRGGYLLPEPGEHRVVLRSPGMREVRLQVDASGARPSPTRVTVRMERARAAELTMDDLPRYQVQESIGFRVTPKSTRVLVDGQLKGPAARLNGRGGRWLKLGRGAHRVSLIAPGHHQVDIAVEVGGGATEKRQVVRLQLPPERP
jgi:hypothetical protein